MITAGSDSFISYSMSFAPSGAAISSKVICFNSFSQPRSCRACPISIFDRVIRISIPVSWTIYATSGAISWKLKGTTMPPALTMAKYAATKSGEFLLKSPTRSPCFTP